MLGGWKVEGVSELSDLILQSGEAPGISQESSLGAPEGRVVFSPF